MNSKALKIAFFGTPEFAAHQLNFLITEGYTISVVITAPDRPAGRGKKVQSSAVKQIALEHKLTVEQPENLKAEAFVKRYREFEIDCAVVVAFRMLPKVIWEATSLGTFNLHASLLPNYRGAAPIQWALRNQESETGLSTFLIDEHIDTGAILLQTKCMITPIDNAEALHDRLMELGPKLIAKTIEGLAQSKLTPLIQDTSKPLKEAPKLTKENTRIDLNLSPSGFCALIRSLDPYPGAHALLKDGETEVSIKIYKAQESSKQNIKKHALIEEDGKVFLGLNQGSIEILKWQFPAKKAVFVKDFLNGHHLNQGIKLL
jgi:methionyl-tRNA formyltransferase